MTTRILVVDDEPDLQPLIEQNFRRGIRAGDVAFLFARDGMEALEKLNESVDVGIVLTDINMPRMDGLTLLDRLQTLDRTIKTVVVSAYGDMENIRTAMNRGAFDFVTKPIDIRDLGFTIDKARAHLEQLRSALAARDRLVLLQKELDDARLLQRNFLPKRFPATPEYEVFADMRPASDVGGDFYDFFELGNGKLGIVIADVSGKGMAAALFMAISRTILRACAEVDPAPGACLARVNDLLCEGNETCMFVTLFYGVLDINTGTVVYANAGHLHPLYVGADGGIETLSGTHDIALGVLQDAGFTELQVQLGPGDRLLLFTDGITEAINGEQEEYGKRRLLDLLEGASADGPRAALESMVDDVFRFADTTPQADDITCLMLCYRGRGATR